MGTIKEGSKWSGVYINGKYVGGLVKNGIVFYKVGGIISILKE